MATDLQKLLELSRSAKMSASEKEQQRRSFAFGNAGMENDLITREMIDQQAEKLKRNDG